MNKFTHILNKIPSGLLVFSGIVVLVITVWSFSDLRELPTYEEWLIYNSFDQDRSIIRYGLGLDYSETAYSTRPLTWLPWWVGYHLYPNSFFGMNLVFLIILTLKGYIAYCLFRKISFQNEALAFAGAVLCLIFPSDSGNLTGRTVNIHLGLLACLLALWLLTLAWEEKRSNRSYLMLALAIGAATFSLMVYEAGILMLLAAPVLLFWLERKINRRMVIYSAVWSVIPLFFLYTMVSLLLSPANYVGTRLATSNQGFVSRLPQNVIQVFHDNFVRSWSEAVNIGYWNPDFTLRALLVTLLVLVPVTYFLSRRSSKQDWRVNAGLMVGGVGFMLLGVIPYFPSEFVNSNWRVYLYAAPGIALFVIAFVNMISAPLKWGKHLAFAALVGVFLVGAIVYTLFSRSVYSTGAEKIETVLISVAERLPDVNEPATIVLIENEAPYLATEGWYTCTLLSECFTPGLRYLYENAQVNGIVCSSYMRPNYNEICEFTPEELVITTTDTRNSSVRTYPYESMVVLTLKEESVLLVEELPGADYAPERFFNPMPEIAARIPEALDWQPLNIVNQYVVDFDEVVADGKGWWPPESSVAWTQESPASLDTHLASDHDYNITFRVVKGITPEHVDGLTLFVNNDPIVLSSQVDETGAYIFQGKIPQTLISVNPVRTQLMFETIAPVAPSEMGAGSDVRTLGVLFDWIRVEPVGVQ